MGNSNVNRKATRFQQGTLQIISTPFTATGAYTVLCPSPSTVFKFIGAILRFDAIGTGPSFDFQTSDLNNGLNATDITFAAFTPVVGVVYVCSTLPGESGSYKPTAAGQFAQTDTLRPILLAQPSGVFCLSASSTLAPSSGFSKCPALVLAGSVSAYNGVINWIIEPVSKPIGFVR